MADIASTCVDHIKLSIVLPAHNEQGNVAPMFEAIAQAMKAFPVSYEVIYVDDGSTDGTTRAVKALRASHRNVRLIRFTRNFGHQAALIAGIRAAKGEGIITMDCDLQHPPARLPDLIAEWEKGALVVQMVRSPGARAPLFKRFWSAAFYKFINMLSYTPVRAGASDFQLLDRVVADQLLRLIDHQPFIRGMIGWLGYETATLTYQEGNRFSGSPSYTFTRSLKLAAVALTRLSRYPLRLSLYIGILVAVLAVGLGLFAILAFFRNETVPGWASVVVPVLFLGGVQMLILGVIGEYLGLVYDASRNLPTYVAYPEDEDVLES